MSVLGNLEIQQREDCIVLRMFTKVDGNDGCYFTYREIETLVSELQKAASAQKRRVEIKNQITALQNEFDDILG